MVINVHKDWVTSTVIIVLKQMYTLKVFQRNLNV